MDPKDDIVMVDEAAKIIGVTESHVRWYFKHGYLRGWKKGERHIIFLRSDVESFERPKKSGRPRKDAKPKKKRKSDGK